MFYEVPDEERISKLAARIAALRLTLEKFNPNHDARGRFSSGPSTGVGSKTKVKTSRTKEQFDYAYGTRLKNVTKAYLKKAFDISDKDYDLVLNPGKGNGGTLGQVKRSRHGGKPVLELWPDNLKASESVKVDVKRGIRIITSTKTYPIRGMLAHEGTHLNLGLHLESADSVAWMNANLDSLRREGPRVSQYAMGYWNMFAEAERLLRRAVAKQTKAEAADATKPKGSSFSDLADISLLSIKMAVRYQQKERDELLGLAVEESLAEMSNIKQRTGKLPGGPVLTSLYNRLMRGATS